MSLESAMQMISDKKKAVILDQQRPAALHEASDGCGIGGELTSLDEMEMSAMQDQSLLQLERDFLGQLDSN